MTGSTPSFWPLTISSMAGPFPAWSPPPRRAPTCVTRFATVTTARPLRGSRRARRSGRSRALDRRRLGARERARCRRRVARTLRSAVRHAVGTRGASRIGNARAVLDPGRRPVRKPRRGRDDETRSGTCQSTLAAQGGRVSAPSYPLSADDLPRWADVVAAVIISSRPGGTKVSGMGQSSEPFAIGDRQLAAMPGLARAAQQASSEAKLAATDFDVVRGRRIDPLR